MTVQSQPAEQFSPKIIVVGLVPYIWDDRGAFASPPMRVFTAKLAL